MAKLAPPPPVTQDVNSKQYKDWLYSIYALINQSGGVLGTMAAQNANSVAITGGSIGGVGITGALYVGEVVNTSSTTSSTSTSTGSIVASGGAGIAGTLNVGGTAKIFSSTASTNTATGALLVAGGVGISGNMTVGGVVGFNSYISVLSIFANIPESSDCVNFSFFIN